MLLLQETRLPDCHITNHHTVSSLLLLTSISESGQTDRPVNNGSLHFDRVYKEISLLTVTASYIIDNKLYYIWLNWPATCNWISSWHNNQYLMWKQMFASDICVTKQFNEGVKPIAFYRFCYVWFSIYTLSWLLHLCQIYFIRILQFSQASTYCSMFI